MKCQECQDKMIAYLEGLLDERTRSLMELHVEACEDCGRFYLENRTLRERLLAAGQYYQEGDVTESIMGQIDPGSAEPDQEPRGPSRVPKIFMKVLKIAALFYLAALGYYGYRAYVWSPKLVNMTVLGQDSLYSGSEAALRVLLEDYQTGKPLEDKAVRIELVSKDSNKKVELGRFRTGPDGCLDDPIVIPAMAGGDYTLNVIPVGWDSDSMSQAITVKRPQRIYVTTDKPLYQPGQTIHMRALALHTVSQKPADRQPVVFEVEDPKGNKVFRAEEQTSEFGIAAADFELATLVNTGLYKIVIDAGGVTSEKSVTVKQYVLPKFKVMAESHRPYYLAGEVMQVTVQADYFFGKPVAAGQVEVVANTYLAGELELFRVTGQTDAQGKFQLEHIIPDRLAGSLRTGGNAVIELGVSVTDTAGHTQQTREPVVVASQAIDVHVIPESGAMVPGLENRVYILTAYPDGRPALCSLNVNGKQVRTDTTGVALLTISGDEETPLRITAVDTQGNNGIYEKSLEQVGDERRFILRTGKAVYRGGEPLAIRVITANTTERMFVDIIKDRQTMLARTLEVEAGRGDLVIDLPASLSGTLRVNAYQINHEGRTVLDTRIVQVQPVNELRIDARPDKPVYRPGDPVTIDLQVTDRYRQSVPAALGVCAVDEAVFYVGENRPGLMEQFFAIDEEMLQPAYQIKFAVSPAQLLGGDERYQTLAMALFSIREKNAVDSLRNAQILKELKEYIDPHILENIQKYIDNPGFSEILNQPRYQEIMKILKPDKPMYSISYANRYDNQKKSGSMEKIFKNTFFRLLIIGTIIGMLILFFSAIIQIRYLILKIVLILFLSLFVSSLFMPALGRSRIRAKEMVAASAMQAADSAIEMVRNDNPSLFSESMTGQSSAPPRVRHYFPETLLWQPQVITDDGGRARIELTAADSITTWRMNIDAVSAGGQLGSCELGLKVFQDFFVDLDLPVALTRNDEITLPVVCYNYLNREQTVELALQVDSWCEVLDQSRKQLTLQPNEVLSVSFRIKAVEVGTHPLMVLAQGQAMSDAIRREVRVKPDGREVNWLVSDSLTGDNRHTLTLAEEAIAHSQQLQLTLYPSTFSEVMEGLDAIFQMPYGCFEQTSSITYPNIMVLQYMLETKQVTPEIEAKARKFIAAGYQRLLTFEVAGGGFDWFGNPPANIMLSAYGVMEFSDMARVHSVDKRIIDRTAAWLFGKQREDGSWPDDRDVHLVDVQRMGPVAPTAYIAWNLAEAGIEHEGVARAMAYLREHLGEVRSPYVMALAANALLAANPNDTAGRQLADVLANRFEQEGQLALLSGDGCGMMYSRGICLDIETTALGTMALMKGNRHGEIVRKALTWLTRQKDSYGSWHSTQSTILTMKALMMGMRQALGSDQTIQLEVQVNGRPAGQAVIDARNSDLVQALNLSEILRPGENAIRISSRGGSIPYRLSGGYWVPDREPGTLVEPGPDRQLDIAVSYDRTRLGVDDRLGCTVTVRNLSGGVVPMAIVDLGIPPGFGVDPAGFQLLQAAGQLARYEITGTQCILYLRALPADKPFTFDYQLKAKYPVKARIEPARVYEYYQPDNRAESQPFMVEVELNPEMEL